MALHRQEKRVTSKLWTTFLSMLVRSGHSHLLKSLKRQIFRNGWSIRVDMEIYLQHGLQQKCAVMVSAGCSQRDEFKFCLLTSYFYIIYYSTYLIYTSFATVLTVEPTEYLEYKIKDGLVSF